jgi:hypothetical protein
MTDKEELRQAFLEGYKAGRGVEEVSSMSVKTAKSRFERWFSLNKNE